MKVGHQDPFWTNVGCHRKQTQNSTVIVLNTKEEYQQYKKAIWRTYEKMEKLAKTKILFPPDTHTFPIKFYKRYDMKIRLIVLGMDRLYLHTTLCGCYFCWAKRDFKDPNRKEWSDHTRHHVEFPGGDIQYEEMK